MDLKNSKTVENLMKSYIGESSVYQRYSYYASRAKKEGFSYIEQIFNETAKNELYHAKRFFSLVNKDLSGEEVTISSADYPVFLGSTLDNLKSAAKGEYDEGNVIYPGFAHIAKEEGFDQIAGYFNLIARVEQFHHKRYENLIKQMENGYFNRESSTSWVCLKCGHTHVGVTPPEKCPICNHEKGYFKPVCNCNN